jgi:hypothetical protein
MFFHHPNIDKCPCEGKSYLRAVFRGEDSGLTFFEALFDGGFEFAVRGSFCELAPAKEVQENYFWLQKTFGIDNLVWVGAYKDPSFVISNTGVLRSPDAVKDWQNVDGSPWHVTTSTIAEFWATASGQPNNNDDGLPENAIAINTLGKLVDVSPALELRGAVYKCCYDFCGFQDRFFIG